MCLLILQKANYTGSTFERTTAFLHVLHVASNCETEPDISKGEQQSAATSTYNFFGVSTALEHTVHAIWSSGYSDLYYDPACNVVSSAK